MKKLLNKKGFTIVELVIVIAVIAILAAVLIPTFSNVVDSAKETATLQEAKGTLDSYIGVMSSNGDSLPDGTVFIVYENDTAAETNATLLDKKNVSGAYVYYKGALHKFDYMSAAKSVEPNVLPTGLSLDKFTLPKVSSSKLTADTSELTADTYISWTEKQKNDFTGAKRFYFAYNQITPVGFDGGSTKCRIYIGAILSIVSNITITAKEEAGAENIELTLASNNYTGVITLSVVKDVVTPKTIILTITTTPDKASYKVESNNLDIATVDSQDQSKVKINKKGNVVLTVTSGAIVKTITLTIN